MTTRGVDYSHWQNPPNTSHAPDVGQMKASGIEFVLIKAWEADSADPNYEENHRNAVNGGLPTVAYVWLHASDTQDRMKRCLDFVGDTVLALDWEQDGVSASVVEAWMDFYEDQRNRQGLAYYGIYPPYEPTARVGQWPRWFPEYTSPSGLKLQPWNGDPHPDWRQCWAIWQSTERGHVGGIEGYSDLNQLAPAITIEDFVAWLGDGGTLPGRVDVVKPAIRGLQLALNHMGYAAGTVDGLWGPNTQHAINDYSGYKP